jgi:hypothetical protein
VTAIRRELAVIPADLVDPEPGGFDLSLDVTVEMAVAPIPGPDRCERAGD